MKDNKEVIQVVKEEVDTMLVKYKLIALLWYYEQFTTKDISNILSIPEEIVDIRIRKVENLIRTKIEKIEIISKSQIPGIVSTAFEMIMKDYVLSVDVATKMHDNIMKSCFVAKSHKLSS